MAMIYKRKIIIRMIPNLITILRIVLTTIVILICRHGTSKFFAVLGVTILVFLTDILDGKLARKLHAETKTGEIMDVLADMGYIFSVSVIMSRMNIISNWFILLVCSEFIIFVITSKYLKDKNRYLVFDVAGRVLAAVYYATPIIMYITFFKATSIHRILFGYGFISLVLFTFVVVIYRISLCRVKTKQITIITIN